MANDILYRPAQSIMSIYTYIGPPFVATIRETQPGGFEPWPINANSGTLTTRYQNTSSTKYEDLNHYSHRLIIGEGVSETRAHI